MIIFDRNARIPACEAVSQCRGWPGSHRLMGCKRIGVGIGLGIGIKKVPKGVETPKSVGPKNRFENTEAQDDLDTDPAPTPRGVDIVTHSHAGG